MRTPVVTDIAVVPVAGHDSMLLNLSGAHGPFFTRNLVILTDSRGPHRRRRGARRRADPAHPRRRRRAGRRPAASATTTPCSTDVRRSSPTATPAAAALQTFDLRTTVHAVTARRVRAARPARPASRGAGRRAARRRPAARPRAGAGLPVLSSATAPGPICRTVASRRTRRRRLATVRHEEALTPEAVVRLAEAATRATASATSSSRAACCPAPTRSRPSSRWPTASPTRASRSIPTAPGCSTTPSGLCRELHRRAGLRRGPVRRRGRLLRPRGDGRVPPRHRTADRDQHDRHRLARAGPCDPRRRRRHPAGRSALLDDGRLGARRAALRRVGADVGFALQQPLRRVAGDVHACRRRGAGRDHRHRHALDLAGRPAASPSSRSRSSTAI